MFFKALREVVVPRRTQESVYDLQKARDELVACEGHLQAQDLVGKMRCAELASGWFFLVGMTRKLVGNLVVSWNLVNC